MIAPRYVMYTGLYFHKVKRIYELHSSEFLREWLKPHGGAWPADMAQFAALTDNSVLGAVASAAVDASHPAHHVVKEVFLSRSSEGSERGRAGRQLQGRSLRSRKATSPG